jgi:hypothetical protein
MLRAVPPKEPAMWTILGERNSYCDGINRRNFLKVGAFGAGLGLTDMLRGQTANKNAKSSPKSAIMVWLAGGPPHIDMYDMKPDAPDNFRGEFKPIQTNVPGVDICEHFPLQAKMWDKFAVLRTVVAIHEHADGETHTGYSVEANRKIHHPSIGAVVSKLRGAERPDIPPYVSLRGLTEGQEPGFLGIAHRAFTPDGPGLKNLLPATGVTAARLEDRKALLASFDSLRRDMDATGTMTGLDGFTARAFDMIASPAVRQALDLAREPLVVRERYKGIEQFLTARRLVEAGVGLVTLGYGGWDNHGAQFGENADNWKVCKKQLPNLDRGLACLIQDLHDRGMADDVVTVCWGEFGRTPKVLATNARDHWPQVMSVVVAGGGLKMGQAVGETTARAEVPKGRFYRVPQVLSTLYHAIGIDPCQTFLDGSGRPRYIVDDREPVRELL